MEKQLELGATFSKQGAFHKSKPISMTYTFTIKLTPRDDQVWENTSTAIMLRSQTLEAQIEMVTLYDFQALTEKTL